MELHDGRSLRFLPWKNKVSSENRNNSYHTLLILSSSSGKKIAQLSFPAFLWRALLIMVVAILLWAGTGTWVFYQNHQLAVHMNSLKKEKQLAQGRLTQQEREIAYLNGRLKSIQVQAEYVRKYLGLGPTGTARGNIGQGGGEDVSPGAIAEASSIAWEGQCLSTAGESAQAAQISHQGISRLERDLDQIIKSLEDREQELAQTPSICPVQHERAWISCGYGMRVSPFTGKKQFHPGLDIAGWKGTPVIAPANGTVCFARKWGSMGLTVKIRHNADFLTTYGHLLGLAVKKGRPVKRGDIIGYIGNSGRSTGYHLHYEIRKAGKRIDPRPYMSDWKKRQTRMASGGSL